MLQTKSDCFKRSPRCQQLLSPLFPLLSPVSVLAGETEEGHVDQRGHDAVQREERAYSESAPLLFSDVVVTCAYCLFYLIHFQHSQKAQLFMLKSTRMTLEADSKIPQFRPVFA